MTAPVKSSKLIKGENGEWEVVIGMEIHAQVTSKAKLFSGAATEFGGEPNAHVSLIDAAMPGMLPVLNEHCIAQAVRTGLGLKAKINLHSVFDRKNYFYPDLPQGYQISQYKSPIVGEGEVVVDTDNNETVTIGIERLHLEQDAGKSLHDQHPSMSLVDLNRSGVALMEIVSKPDLRTADEAKAYVTKLRAILRYLGTCDGDMEKGSLRADVNVSVRKPGEPLGTRCEIKNINSIRFIGQAIEHEARRQIGVIEDGGKIEQETRLFDSAKGETRSMRTKEEAHDYRYFPDPDLLPLELSQEFVDELERSLPELPDAKKARFLEKYGLSKNVVGILIAELELANYYEQMITTGAEPKAAANWLINEYLGQLNKKTTLIHSSRAPWPEWPTMGPVGPAANSAIVQIMSSGDITGKNAKKLLSIVLELPRTNDPKDIKVQIFKHGLEQATDSADTEKVIDEIIAKNPDKAAEVKVKPKALGWFVGEVMKATGGKANPQAVNELLKKKLGI